MLTTTGCQKSEHERQLERAEYIARKVETDRIKSQNDPLSPANILAKPAPTPIVEPYIPPQIQNVRKSDLNDSIARFERQELGRKLDRIEQNQREMQLRQLEQDMKND